MQKESKIIKFVKSKKYIALIIISFVLIIIGTIRTSYAQSYTRAGLQNRVISAAISYLYSHTHSDYEQLAIDDDDVSPSGALNFTYAFRTFNLSPDEVSRTNNFHIDCSSFATSTYIHSIGYDFSQYYTLAGKSYQNREKYSFSNAADMSESMKHYYRGTSTTFFQTLAEDSLTTESPVANRSYRRDYTVDQSDVSSGHGYNNYASSIKDNILVYYRKSTTSTTKASVVEDLETVLEPGDLFIRRMPKSSGGTSGHVVVYVGNKINGTGATSKGIIEARGADLARGTYNTSDKGKDVFSIRYTRSYEYMVGDKVADYVYIVLRPLNKFCGTGSEYTSCDLTGDNLTKAQEATAREVLSKVNEEQFAVDASGKTISKYGSVNVGENITYRLRLRARDTFPFCYKDDGNTTQATTRSDCDNTWTNISANNGTSDSTVVKNITATVPDGTTFVSCNRNCTCSANPCVAGSTLTWNFTGYDSKVNSSDTANNLFVVNYTVKPNSSGLINNTNGFKITNTVNTNTLTLGSMKVNVNPSIRRFDESKISNSSYNNSSTGSGLEYAKNIYSNAYGSNWNFLTANNINSAIFSQFTSTVSGATSDENYDIVGSNSSTTVPETTTDAGRIHKMMVTGMYGGYLLRGNDSKDLEASRIDRIKYIDESDFEVGDIIFRKKATASSFTADVYMGNSTYRSSSSSSTSNDSNFYARTLHNDKLFVVLRPSKLMAKVSYNLNGGTGTTPSPFLAYGTYNNLTTTGPTKSENTFAGWYTTGTTGGTKVTSTTSLPLQAGLPYDHTLYARWSATVPTTSYCKNLTYNGSSQTLVNAAGTGFTWTSGTTRTDAGSQSVKATLASGYAWSDGTTEDKTITCSIEKKNITIAAKTQLIEYNESIKTGVNYVTASGLVSGHNVGSITLTQNNTSTSEGTIIPSNAIIKDSANDEVTNNYNITYIEGAFSTRPLENYTVTFNSNGGSSVASQEVVEGGKVTEPAAPTRTGYSFEGWYTNSELTTEYDFNGSVNNDMTLYAKWSKLKYQVTFNSNGGSSVEGQEVYYEETVTRPTNPVKEGYAFEGWYTSSELTTEYDFNSQVKRNITLYAKWEANTYTITFNTNGGTSISPLEAAYGENITEPETPSKEGHTFAGWYSDSELTNLYVFNTMPANNLTLYAKWNRSEYQVIFSTDGGSAVENQNVLYGDKVTKPSNPIKNGYTFDGWYSDSNLTNSYNFDNAVTKSIILYAKWEAEEYQIAYTLNGGVVTNPTSYTIETNTFTLNEPVKEGYTFIGWTGSNGTTPEKTVTISKGTTGDKEYVAHYEVIEYTISFDSNGGSTVPNQKVNYGDKVLEPVTPSKEGYAFAGWYSDSSLTNRYDFNTTVTGAKTLYAKWVAGDYQITYNLNGGVANNPTNYNVNTETFTLNEPVKEGYTFIGWTGSNGTTPEKNVTISKGTTGDKEYVAHYEKIEYTIEFNYEGIDSIEGGYGDAITLPTPRKTGYSFLGWYKDQSFTELFASETMPSENLTLYPKFEINTYTINLETNGGNSISDIEVVYNESIGNIPTPIKEGYRFLGWYTDRELTEEFNITNMPANDLTLYAKWEANVYTVTFNSNGGNSVPSVTVAYNEVISMPTNPEKNGYTFEGWYSNNELTNRYDFSSRVTSDITLYAKWDIRTYSISYDLDGGVADNRTSYTINTSTFTLNNPTKEGYTFEGWTGSNGSLPEKDVTIEEGTTGDKIFLANYRVNSYTISFDSNGGSSVSDITKNYGETVTAPTAPTKSGYKFAGWYSDSELTRLYSFTTMPSRDITLYAKWTNDQSIINYVLNGGTNDPSNPTTYTEGESVTIKDPTRDGYIFKGWYTDSSFTQKVESITESMTGDITLYAKWEMLKYQIIFETNGGEEKESIELGYGEEIPNIKDPVRLGYKFKGWYIDRELTNIFSEEVMPEHDITIYAKWEANTYKITFDSNGGSKVEAYEGEYNTPITEPTSPLKEGYKFAGWYSDSSLTKLYSFDRMPAKDITLYAKWVSNSKNVISYNLNGGKNNIKNPSSYTSGKNIILYNPVKRGSKFAGWYLEGDFQTRVYNITKEMNGDLVLYAKWIPEEGIYVPNTGNNISIIAIISGVVLISIGGYFILSKKKILQK